MSGKTYRVSVKECGYIEADNFEEFYMELLKKGINKIDLKYFDMIDDNPNFYKSDILIEDFNKDHFNWLNETSQGKSKFMRANVSQNSILNDLDFAVFSGLRKTINRFREKPMLFFTESDLHSFIQNDILIDHSKTFIDIRKNISLVHLEYPTNFRYNKNLLLGGYGLIDHKTNTDIEIKTGDRGNFDVAVLNPDFINKIYDHYKNDQDRIIHLINKDIKAAIERKNNKNYNPQNSDPGILSNFEKELNYAVEVKFIHHFNARNRNMLDEIIKDNEKLSLAYAHSGRYVKPINLVFCSTDSKERRDNKKSVINQIKDYFLNGNIKLNKDGSMKTKWIPKGVLNIFIESFYDNDGKKTIKPIAICRKPKIWAKYFCEKVLKVELIQ